ncbi:FAD:protein FMN transferase [Puniceicoccaceae bacterium K14]|nr:FAD:protein FMN transferase [Puniceicoccaceae bacterium K14]
MVLAKNQPGKTIDVRMSYDSEQDLYIVSFEALGAACSIRFSCFDRNRSIAFAQSAVKWLADFETKYSRFRDDSVVSQINRLAGKEWVEIDDELVSIFSICDDLHFMTDGVLDPTALPLLKLWDYRTRKGLPEEEKIRETLELVGWKKVERSSNAVFLPKEGMALDFGGFGKEYAVDKIAAIAVEHGIESCLVDLGRDIHVLGTPPKFPAWHIALENPEEPGKAWSSLACLGGGIATSGDYRRFFESGGKRYGHILDPRSGRPVANEVLSVTVIANSCLEAGVLSTTCFIMGQDCGMELIENTSGAEGCYVMQNGIYQSKNFHAYVAN